MDAKTLVSDWFAKWEAGDFHNLPVTAAFKHTSPFGTIDGRDAYVHLVEINKDKFLGYHFKIHDTVYAQDRACVRYTATQGDFKLDVSEWYYLKDDLIDEIITYYHIGEIREERKLDDA